jgi:D-psicose/D-tagatose/L-ribulose 3-epimerase
VSPSRLSICEWIFAGRPLGEVAALARANGFGAVEIAGEPRRPDRAAIAGDLGGLAVSGTTAMGRWPSDERDLTHSEKAARRRAVSYYKECVDLAAEVGAPVVGLSATASGRLEPLTDRAREWDYAVAAVRELGEYAGASGVKIGIEPINRYETHLVNTLEQALALREASGSKAVGVVADAFHMQIEEEDPGAALAATGDALLAIHLADSTRLGLGHGSLALEPLLRRAGEGGFSGPLVMEFTAPGPLPFEPDKGPETAAWLERYASESAAALGALIAG